MLKVTRRVLLLLALCVCQSPQSIFFHSSRYQPVLVVAAAETEELSVDDVSKEDNVAVGGGGGSGDNVNNEDNYDRDEEVEAAAAAAATATSLVDNALVETATNMLNEKFRQALDDVKKYMIEELKGKADGGEDSGKNDLLRKTLTPSIRQFLVDNSLVNDLQSFHFADRHIKEVQEMANDPDCMSREVDLNDPNYDILEAADVLYKCRLLIIRNVHNSKHIDKFRTMHGAYLRALQQGKTTIDKKVLYDPSIRRYELMIPKEHYSQAIAENKNILRLLEVPQILDESLFIHSFGTSITEPNTPHQHWHEEDNYILNTADSFEMFGIAGHDLPPYTINMFTPLLNLTYDHGPTEFCLGSSIMTGLYRSQPLFEPNMIKQTKDGKFKDFEQLFEFG